MDQSFDVVIAGGGLAGLTLALQLRAEAPEASVAVVERTSRPLPEACHKVGESSVEIGSHYFGKLVGLATYLEEKHLKKNGLRFLAGDHRGPIAERPEIGPAEFPIVPSYQMDRGTLESDLRARCEASGVALLEGRSVRDITLASPHEVSLDGGETLRARWIVDASGRRRLLSKKLGLRRPSPNRSSAAWFRVARPLKLAELADQDARAWRARDVDDNRWLSTVHLMGPGYWVWLIPLSSGYTSIGIVADAEHHDFASFNREAKARDWLDAHEPVLAARLEELDFEDFRVVHDYSYLSAQVLSTDRWACVGEAALFVDPLYSLGSDFLAMANCYATRAIVDDLQGDLDESVVQELDTLFRRLAEDAARTLSGNGRIFPHGHVLGAKLWWDFFNYWSNMSAHFFQEVWRADAETLRRFRELGEGFYALNTCAQDLLETWAALKAAPFSKGCRDFVPLPMFPSVLADQHLALEQPLGLEDTFAKMERDLATGRELVLELVAHALLDLPPAEAARFGARARIGAGEVLALKALRQRAELDGLPRRERHRALPRIARDLERALGRPRPQAPLRDLMARAVPLSAPVATQAS